MHHYPGGKMVPVFVSSMKSAIDSASTVLKSSIDSMSSKMDLSVKALTSSVNNVKSTVNHSVSSMASTIGMESDTDLFSQTEDDNILTNLTKCGKGGECAEKEVNDNEKETNDLKVKNYINDHPDCVMMVFAPWCAHCKTAMPHFTEARKKTATPMALINSNMVSQQLLANDLQVTHFPFIFRKTQSSTEIFKGRADTDTIAEFAKKSELQMMFM